MKNKVIFAVFFLILCSGILFISYARFEKNREVSYQNIQRQGMFFLKAVVLAYDGYDKKGDRQYLLKELFQITSGINTAYLIFNEKNNQRPLISFPNASIHSLIPDSVKDKAMQGIGSYTQTFTANDGREIMEFSNPIYKDGEVHIIVRMGLPLPGDKFFSMKHMNLPLQIVFFIIMAMVFGYYALMLQLKANAQCELNEDILSKDLQGSIPGIVHQMEISLNQLQKEKNEADLKKNESLVNLKIVEHEYQQLANILNGIDFAVLLLDMRETVYFANSYFLNLLNLEPDQLINRNIFDNIDHKEFVSFVRQLGLMGQGNDTRQIEMSFPDVMQDDTFLVSALSITDADGLTFGSLIKIMNISKEKAAAKSQSNFINHIAHELRTPLTNIRAYNEMMMEGEITDLEVQKEFFNTINDETNRLSELIKNILNLAETEIGQIVPNKEMVKTKWLVKSCIDSIEAVAREKNIELEQNLPDNLPRISGDKEMLKAALINVVGNAVKYTPEKGKVRISVRENTESILFEVEDTGYGISENDLPHIFEKFYRAKEGQVLDETGSGLGLAITTEIIKTHGGEIEVESSMGKGSKFIITLPKGNIQIG